ncbi:MAG: hypothetical protein QF441_01015 [Bacteriovoracaceae bacterium]|nr:hypothetical protein [Bacteriovoracaceae bacterium]
MKNNRIQLLLIFIVTVFSFNTFGIDYFWLTGMELSDGSRVAGVKVGEVSEGKLKKYFNKDFTIIYTKKDGHVVKKDIRKVKLTDKTYTFERVSYVDEVNIGISLTRLLAIEPKGEEKFYGYIALPTEYKIEEIKILNLRKSKFTDKHKLYLDAIKNSNGVIPEKTAKYMLANTDSLSIYEDVDKPSRFAIIRGVVFLDKKPVIYNSYGFSPFSNEADSLGFLFKINGRVFLLAEFGHYVQRKHYVERVRRDHYLVDLEKGKIYLPMHLREEK